MKLQRKNRAGTIVTLCLLGAVAAAACSGEMPDAGEATGKSGAGLDAPVVALEVDERPGLDIARQLAPQQLRLKERFAAVPELALRVSGDRLEMMRNPSAPPMDIELSLPGSATGTTLLSPIGTPSDSLTLTPERANDVQAVIDAEGRANYRNAFPNTDLIVHADHNRLSQTLVLRGARSPDHFTWRLETGQQLSRVQSNLKEVSFVNEAGHLRITAREVVITDALGVSRTAQLDFSQPGQVSLAIEVADLTYPVVAQLEFDVPVYAMAIAPPEVVKARLMVLMDTSGSMAWRFNDGQNTGGDSDGTAVFCDNAIGTGFACNSGAACTIANGGLNLWPAADPVNEPSRMLAAKAALFNVTSAHSGLIDFGLMRFARNAGVCPNQNYCCQPQANGTTPGRCADGQYYGPFPLYPQPCTGNADCIGTCNGQNRCACTSNAQCSAGYTCDAGICVTTNRNLTRQPCTSNGQCDDSCNIPPAGNGFCDCGNNNDCDTGYVCQNAGGSANDWCWAPPLPTAELTYQGSCGGAATGADILVPPTTGSGGQVRRWVDFVEDFCSSTGSAGGAPRNPELRADGFTPLARAVQVARTNWYEPITTAQDNKLNCRPYVFVVLTDGADSCSYEGLGAVSCDDDGDCSGSGGNCSGGGCDCKDGYCVNTNEDSAPEQVRKLTAVNSTNPVTTYVLGMGNVGGLNVDVLNDMAIAGGTGPTAPIATNQTQIEAAFADIVADTVKFEQCNGIDDNCNVRIDEGLGVYQECAAPADCGSNTCDAGGRCTCTQDAQCAAGFTCAADSFCRPACNVGTGQCRQDGVRKCGGGGAQCCVDDGLNGCTPLTAGTGSMEQCNTLDDDCDGEIDEDFPQGCTCPNLPEICNTVDDDCDGLVDNDDPDLTGVGDSCGSTEGACSPGNYVCTPTGLDCQGRMGPYTEVCNGIDDNCDGATDGQTRACYTGPALTEDVGICHGGTQVCVATAQGNTPGVACTGNNCWGTCVGEVTPQTEICDGRDNDCDREIDEDIAVPGSGGAVTGDECCPNAFSTLCGIGVCRHGTWACDGGGFRCVDAVGPTDEICDGFDNDCNDEVDDVPGLGDICNASNGCGGTKQCIVNAPGDGEVRCVANDMGTPEICNNIDDDCDGKIDELPDVVDNDPAVGIECNQPPEGHREPPCAAGETVCVNGLVVCRGDTQPKVEICNGEDDDCDGEDDNNEAECPAGSACFEGECAPACRSGEFPCPSGRICRMGYCVPDPGVPTGTGGDTSTGGTTGSGGSDNGGSGGTGVGGSAGDPGTGGDGMGGTDPATGGSESTGGTTAGSSNAGGTTTGGDENSVYGLISGGGGCACRAAPSALPKLWGVLAGLVLVGGSIGRRRSRRRAPACAGDNK